jgi:hypothetical protein
MTIASVCGGLLVTYDFPKNQKATLVSAALCSYDAFAPLSKTLISRSAVRECRMGVFRAAMLEEPEDAGNGPVTHQDTHCHSQNDCYYQKKCHPERDQVRLTREDAPMRIQFASQRRKQVAMFLPRLGTLRINS